MKKAGFKNDIASSLRIPYGISAHLYSDVKFKGTFVTINGPFYEDDTLKHTCVSLVKDFNDLTSSLKNYDFNDRTSSLKVYKTAELGNFAKSYWRQIPNSEGEEFSLSIGIKMTNKREYILTKQEALNYEMSNGISFDGSKSGVRKIRSNYAEPIMLNTL